MAEHRKRELEEKKAKLDQLRKARDERKAALARAQKGGPEPAITNRKDVNDLVDQLIGSSSSSTRPASPFAPSGSSRIPTPSATYSGRATPPVPHTPGGRTSRLSNDGSVSAEQRRAPSRLEMSMTGPRSLEGERDGLAPAFQQNVDFVDHSAELYELPSKAAKPTVTYSKAIQTSTSMSTSTSDLDSDSDTSVDVGQGMTRRRRKKREDGGSGRETEEEMRTRILAELEEERKALENELKELKEKGEEIRTAELSDEQRQAIFAAPDFSAFIEESTKIVQRALSDGYDYIRDYSIGLDGAFDEAEGQKVKLFCAFSDQRWTAGRSVTDLDWSQKFPELAVASYNKKPSAPNDPDGIVCVWNLHLLERPEYVFHAPSDVLSVTFSPFHPTLIFGGSYSGQVLLWDTRAKHLPVLKTPLSAAGHTYPIYAMKMIGTQNANNLISSSTDGLVCSWLADMLAQPQEALPLTIPSHNKTDEVSITALDFPPNDSATFWVGTEEGSVYQASRYDRASAKAGLSASADDIYRGHAGPVTGLHFHPSTGSVDFGDLFLTSSVDWTVKLWRAKAGSATAKSGGGTGSANSGADKERAGVQPVKSFEEADDYVFDVKWHPHHPAVFGTVDGSGKFDLWNLNEDAEVPTISTQVGNRAINKLAWDRTPLSRKVGLGSSDGKLYVYDVAEKVVTPRDAEWADMQKTVQGLVASRDGGSGLGSLDIGSTANARTDRYR